MTATATRWHPEPHARGAVLSRALRGRMCEQLAGGPSPARSGRAPVVSGLLNRFRDEGLISYTRRGLIEVNREALQTHLDSIAET